MLVEISPVIVDIYPCPVSGIILREESSGFDTFPRYEQFADDVKKCIASFRSGMMEIEDHYKIAAFGASAKGNTLLNCACRNYWINYIVDETPNKIGKFTPGNRRPIISFKDFTENFPDYLIILAWNFADEIMEKCRAAGYTGKFVIPIPEWKVL